MDRRKFVKVGAVGLVGAVKARAESSGETRQGKQEEHPSGILERFDKDAARVLFHCHCFPPNPERFPLDPETGMYPGSPKFLSDFASRHGFDYATAFSPFEVPVGRCTSRIDPEKDGLAWLQDQAEGLENILLFASLNPESPDSGDRLAKARHREGSPE